LAFELLLKASHLGHLHSIYQCFLFLSRGIGTQRDINQSIYFLQSAGEHGFFDSFIENGLFFMKES
jgi:TPR repeat protein